MLFIVETVIIGMEQFKSDGARSQATTVGVRKSTKARLDKNRAPGQCYNGFICQLIDLWEEANRERITSSAGPAGGDQGAEVQLSHQLK